MATPHHCTWSISQLCEPITDLIVEELGTCGLVRAETFIEQSTTEPQQIGQFQRQRGYDQEDRNYVLGYVNSATRANLPYTQISTKTR